MGLTFAPTPSHGHGTYSRAGSASHHEVILVALFSLRKTTGLAEESQILYPSSRRSTQVVVQVERRKKTEHPAGNPTVR